MHERLLLVCILTTLWGIRLTYNFYRRGGYGNLITHEEDYRWPILRKWIGNKWLFMLFNLTFIASYQNLLLMAIALPAHGVMLGESVIGIKDCVLAVIFLSCWQLRPWQISSTGTITRKLSVNASEREFHPDKDVRNGFYQSGLFAFCRHPNYFAEQSMWVVVYAFSLTKDIISNFSDLITAYGLGIFMLITLFQVALDSVRVSQLANISYTKTIKVESHKMCPGSPTRPVTRKVFKEAYPYFIFFYVSMYPQELLQNMTHTIYEYINEKLIHFIPSLPAALQKLSLPCRPG